jgi:Family of unknown function (DUF5681)
VPFPNPATQFKPGQSGNPSGRPRSKPLTDRLRDKLEEVGEDGRTVADAVVDRWLEMVADGDATALREALARVEGKVIDQVEHSGELRVRVEYEDAHDPAPATPLEAG